MTPRRPRARRRAGLGGFTLIELAVVLAILAIVTALVLPVASRGTERVRLRAEAGRVAALVRQARQHAVSHRREARVVLDRARNTVALHAPGGEQAVRELALPPGIRVNVAHGPETLIFSPRGITRQARWVLEASGGRRLAVNVEGVTGRVSVAAEEGA